MITEGISRLRFLAPTLLLVCSLSPAVSHAKAQATAPLPAFSKADATAYSVLFRRVNTYNQLSQNMASTDNKAFLSRSIRDRLKLSDAEFAILLTLARNYDVEMSPLRAKVSQTTSAFRARFPHNLVPPGSDLSPPVQLGALQAQEESLVSKYRDLLQNKFASATFQYADVKIRSDYGNPAISDPSSLAPIKAQ